MNIAFQLFQLQEIDSDLDNSDKRIGVINELIADDSPVSIALNKYEESKKKFLQDTNTFNTINDDIQRKKDKISQSESTLYGGTVKNPKELEDLQLEIASLKKAIAKLEDQLLVALIQLEESEKNQEINEQALTNAKSDYATQESMLKAEKETLTQSIQSLVKKKDSILPQIDMKHIGQYESLRKKKRGLAVTVLRDDACGACGSSLTASQRQEARSPSKLFICPSCSRIIYGSS